jgi:hypothetical protein
VVVGRGGPGRGAGRERVRPHSAAAVSSSSMLRSKRIMGAGIPTPKGVQKLLGPNWVGGDPDRWGLRPPTIPAGCHHASTTQRMLDGATADQRASFEKGEASSGWEGQRRRRPKSAGATVTSAAARRAKAAATARGGTRGRANKGAGSKKGRKELHAPVLRRRKEGGVGGGKQRQGPTKESPGVVALQKEHARAAQLLEVRVVARRLVSAKRAHTHTPVPVR